MAKATTVLEQQYQKIFSTNNRLRQLKNVKF